MSEERRNQQGSRQTQDKQSREQPEHRGEHQEGNLQHQNVGGGTSGEQEYDRAKHTTTLSKFQENCSLFVQVVNKADSPLDTTLRNFITWVEWIDQGKGTKAHEEFFYHSAVPQMASAVLKRYYKDDQLPLVNTFICSLVKALVDRIRSHAEVNYSDPEVATLVELLRPTNNFYASYGLEEAKRWRQQHAELNLRSYQTSDHVVATAGEASGADFSHHGIPEQSVPPNLEEWLHAFGQGDSGFVYSDSLGQWMPCRVLQISPTNTEIEVEILEVGDEPSVIERKWFPKDPKIFRPSLDNPSNTLSSTNSQMQGSPQLHSTVIDSSENKFETGNKQANKRPPSINTDIDASLECGLEWGNSSLKAANLTENSSSTFLGVSNLKPDRELSELKADWESLSPSEKTFLSSLEPGIMLDACLIGDGNWYQAVIVSVEKGSNMSSSSDQDDILLVTFVGFPPNKDTNLPRSAISMLAPLNSRSFGRRGLYASKAINNLLANSVVDDTKDPEDAATVMRFSHNKMVSRFFVMNLEHFINVDGFQTVMFLLKNHPSNLDLARHLLSLFAGVGTTLSRTLAQMLLPSFLHRIFKIVDQMPQPQVRQLSKHFVQETLERATKIAHRCMAQREASSFIEDLAIKFAEKRLQCPAIMQRLDGMDLVVDLIDRVKNAEVYPAGLAYRQTTMASSYTSESNGEDSALSTVESKERTKNLLSSVLLNRSQSFEFNNQKLKTNSDHAPEVRFAAPAEGPSTPTNMSTQPSASAFMTPPKAPRARDDSALPTPSLNSSVNSRVQYADQFEYTRISIAWKLNKILLSEWIIQSKAIENAVRGPLAHSEMTKRAARLLVFLSGARMIPEGMLATMWQGVDEAKGSDKELADAILTMMAETVPSMRLAEVEKVLSFFVSEDPAQLSPKALEILREICKYSQTAEGNFSRSPSIKALDILFNFATDTNIGAVSKAAEEELRSVVVYHASLDMMRAFKKPSGVEKTTTNVSMEGDNKSEQTRPSVPNVTGSKKEVSLTSDQATLMFNVLTAAQAAAAGCGLDEDGRTFREVLISRVLACLQRETVIAPALHVLQHVIYSYPRSKELGPRVNFQLQEHLTGRESREDVVAWLERWHSIIDLCFGKCKELCTDFKYNFAKYSSSLTHLLDFVLILLNESDLVLTENQLASLWETLVKNPQARSNEQTACFRFITFLLTDYLAPEVTDSEAPKAKMGDNKFVGLDVVTLDTIFTDHIGNLMLWRVSEESETTWPMAAFSCLQFAMLQLNRAKGHLAWAPSKPSASPVQRRPSGLMYMLELDDIGEPTPSMDSVRVLESEHLQGEDVLWYLALHAKSDKTSSRAADMLCRLHLGAALQTYETLEYRKTFVEKAMRELQAAISVMEESFVQGSRAAIRCLGLVRPLLQFTEKQTSILCEVLGNEAWEFVAPHSASTVGQSFEVTVSNNFKGSAGHNTKSVIMLSTKDPVWRLREQIAHTIGLESAERLRIFAGGKEIKLDTGAQLIRDMHGLSPGVTIMACEKPPAGVAADMAARKSLIFGVAAASEQKSNDMDVPGGNADPELTQPPLRSPAESEIVLAKQKLSVLPSVILASNSKYSEMLFNLLDVCADAAVSKGSSEDQHAGNTLSADVWKLLQALPSSESFQDMGRLLEEVQKDKVSLLKLLYAIELIESLFAPGNGLSKSGLAHQFIEAKGIQCIMDQLTKVIARAPGELEAKSMLDFRASQILSIIAKLLRISFFTVAAYIKHTGPGMENLVYSLMPRLTTMIRLQKEVDLSGLVLMDMDSAFPFTTACVGNTQSTVLPELSSLQYAMNLFRDVAGLREIEAAANAAENALRSFVLHPVVLTNMDTELLPGIKRSLLNLCAFGIGTWALTRDPALSSAAYLSPFLQNGLVCNHGFIPTITRFVFRNAFQHLAREKPLFGAHSLEALSRVELPTETDLAECDQYFKLFEGLMSSPEVLANVQGSDVFAPLVKNVREILTGEDLINPRILEGYFHILKSGVSRTDLQVAEHICKLLLTECLYPDGGADVESPSLAPEGVRLGAFRVLAEAVIVHPSLWNSLVGSYIRKATTISFRDLYEFQAQKNATFSSSDMPDASSEIAALSGACWSVELGTDQRAPCGFQGLVNLGFICYMNSLVQQLFNIPRLRYGILRARLPPPNKANTDTDTPVTQEQREVLLEFQRMMGALDLSIKQAYNPTAWCQVFKDEQGQPVNLFEQQDAHEFFNTLCDRVDEMLQQSGQRKLISDAIGVSIANQLLCVDSSVTDGLHRENPAVREYCLTQELGDGVTSLRESLRNFVAGEVINDYSWEERGNAKLRTLKRQCIADLSDVVFVHLKRFRLNWTTFMTEKINSRFEFPLEIDFFPYTKEGLEWKGYPNDEKRYGERGKAYYQFELAGVVVHSGASLNSGHYYSYIRSRFGPTKGQWFEFNDRIVKPFDLSSLEEATFGGGLRTSSYGVEIPSANNAYMLVYERKQMVQDEAEFMGAEAASFVTCGKAVPEIVKLKLMPEGLTDSILHQNRIAQAVQRVFEPGVTELFKAVALADQGPPQDPQFAMDAVVYALDTLARSMSGRTELPDLLMGLQRLIIVQPGTAQTCLDLIAERSASENLLPDLLLQQVSEIVREGAGALLGLLLAESLAQSDTPWPGLDIFLSQLIDPVLNSVYLRGNLQNHTQWWAVVRTASRHSEYARNFLVSKCIIAHAIDIFMGNLSPLRAVWSNFPELGPEPPFQQSLSVSGSMAVDWKEPFGVIRELCEGDEAERDLPGWCALQSPDVLEQALLYLHQFEQEHRICNPRETPAESIGVIYAYVCKHKPDLEVTILDAIIRHIAGASYQSMGLYFAILEEILRSVADLEHIELSLRQPFAEIADTHASNPLYLCEFTRYLLSFYLEQPRPILPLPLNPEDRNEAAIMPWLGETVQHLHSCVSVSRDSSSVSLQELDPPEVTREAQSSGASTAGESGVPKLPCEDMELLASMYEDFIELLSR